MAKIRFKETPSRNSGGEAFEVGKVYNVRPDTANHWLARGVAERVPDDTPAEGEEPQRSGSDEPHGGEQSASAHIDARIEGAEGDASVGEEHERPTSADADPEENREGDGSIPGLGGLSGPENPGDGG